MDNIGYIITRSKLNNVLSCVKVVSSLKSVGLTDKPILIIGLEEAKKHASSFSILDKKLSDNIFWTFGKREKRSEFEKDVEEFQNYVVKQKINGIRYYYFNVLTQSYSKVKKLLYLIKTGKSNIFYINKNMVYLYRDDYVIGVSIEMLEYCGITKKKIINLITQNLNNRVFDDNCKLGYQIKKLINNKKYIIPYLISLNLIN